MAILTPKQKARIRQFCARDESPDWTKEDINAAMQAIEDWYESERATVAGLINTATSPYTFTNAMKKKIGKYWLQHKFGVE